MAEKNRHERQSKHKDLQENRTKGKKELRKQRETMYKK